MYTQENRSLVVTTPLGDDVVLLTRFSGTEGLSVPFSFDLDLVSENNNLAFENIIGENVTVSIGHADENRRFFNGIISRFALDSGSGEIESAHGLVRYSAKMVPWFWLLTRTSNSRIFQNLSVPDIVEKIFTEKGFKDYTMNIGKYDPKEYCVQYGETDFNFVSRLLEQEGIYYFFEHENGKHTMVLGDTPDKHSPCPNHTSVRYHPVTTGESPMEGVIVDLDKMQEIRIGKYTVNDFNFENPNTDLKVEAVSQSSLGPGEREHYDFPAEYKARSEGERLANIRLQAEEARVTTITGKSSCKGFSSGYKFDLSGHYRSELNDKSYVLVSVSHDAAETAGGSGEQAGEYYTNRFACIPFEVPYRPPVGTPEPMIGGVQTAIVVGPSGQEIHTDEHGRVKVQFPWDREGKSNENSSCWIRVSQPWAGTGWGAVYLPRIGQEVIVDFLESDPDRPIITGRVFNAVNTPPYSLPGEKTKSTIKSMSSPDGGGFNEIRFEDKKGEEQIFIHSEKNFDLRIKNDRFETIGNDRHLHVEKDKFEHVENNRSETVDADHKEEIGKDRHLDVKGKEAKQVAQSLSLTVKGDVIEAFKANHSEQTGKDYYLKAQNIVIEGMTNITLSVGGSYIAIESGSIEIKTAGEIKIDGSKVSISGSGMTEIKGGMVKIN